MNEPIKGNSQAAVDFLMQWGPSTLWTIAAADPEHKALTTQTFDRNSAGAAKAFIEHWNGKRNLYFMVNAARDYIIKKAKKEDLGWFIALHVDIDPVAPPEGVDVEEHYSTERTRIETMLENYDPPPSVITFSGGGYQGFWLLKEPVEIDEQVNGNKPWEKYEAFSRKIEKDLGADHCFNIDRIMRLPGTINIPDEKKRKKGRTLSLARLVSADWSLRYQLDEFEPYVEEKKERRSTGKKRKAKNDQLEDVIRILRAGPDHEGPRSFNGDKSDALWWVVCSLIRFGNDDDEIVAMILDKENKLSEHVHKQSNPEQYARRQVERAREKVGEDFERDDSGKIYVNQHNIRLALSQLGIRLSYNSFNRKDMMEGPDNAPMRVIQKRDVVKARLMIEEQCYFRAGKEYFEDVLLNECKENEFHPVRDYLDNLKWDGKARIDTWLTEYGGADDTEYTRAVGSLILIAAVRRIRQPGVKFDEMMIFESAQGLNKSTALATLAVKPEWFSDSLPLNADDKLLIETIDGKWIVEAPELKGMRNKDVEHLKSMLSRQVDRARMAYDSIVSEVPRQSVIFATTNSKSYLSDATGNRRFWPVLIKMFDIARLKADVNQLWAEASLREANGESIRLAPELYEVARKEQEERVVEDPWYDDIEKALRNTPEGKFPKSDVWKIINVLQAQRTSFHYTRIAEVMTSLGWNIKRARIGKNAPKCYVKGEGELRVIVIEREEFELKVGYEDNVEVIEQFGQRTIDPDIPF